jgi:hypothetical protein
MTERGTRALGVVQRGARNRGVVEHIVLLNGGEDLGSPMYM